MTIGRSCFFNMINTDYKMLKMELFKCGNCITLEKYIAGFLTNNWKKQTGVLSMQAHALKKQGKDEEELVVVHLYDSFSFRHRSTDQPDV